ncbi:MAG: hypothetical protein ACRDZ3_02485 [Acidimicrobiia bacterium]
MVLVPAALATLAVVVLPGYDDDRLVETFPAPVAATGAVPVGTPEPAGPAKPSEPVTVGTASFMGIDHRAAGIINLYRHADGRHVVGLEDFDIQPGQETFPGISHTAVYSHQDGLANPAADDTGTSSLHGGGGRITNVAVQDVCPVHFSDHIKMASYDAVGYDLALDALTHDGPADPARIGPSVCTREFPPGVDPVTFPVVYATGHAAIAVQLATAPRVDAEPALRCYVTAAC